jgi:hypothetical protein
MSLNSRYINGNLAFNDTHLMRMIDGIGAGVKKLLLDGSKYTVADFTETAVSVGAGTSNIAVGTSGAGSLVLTCAANENDGIQTQYDGENFKFDGNPLYFGISLQLNDATQTDFLAGLCITDTTLLGGMTDGVYFSKVDASQAVTLELEKDSTATSTAAGTAADATDIILEFYYDGTNIHWFVDGVQGSSPVTTNLPDDEALTPSIALLTGEAIANTMTVNWMRCIQFRS